MKIRCPKCSAAGAIDEARIPAQGTRVKCPKCGGQIFVRVRNKEAEARSGSGDPDRNEEQPARQAAAGFGTMVKISSEPQGARPTSTRPSAAPTRPESETGGRLQRKSESKDGDLEWAGDLPLMTMAPLLEKRTISIILIGLIVIAAGALLYIGLRQPALLPGLFSKPRTEGQTLPPPKPITIQDDVKSIKQKLLMSKNMGYIQRRPGPEFRLIYDILEECGQPCTELKSVKVYPLRQPKGFRCTANCGDFGRYKINYFWKTNTASVDGTECF